MFEINHLIAMYITYKVSTLKWEICISILTEKNEKDHEDVFFFYIGKQVSKNVNSLV